MMVVSEVIMRSDVRIRQARRSDEAFILATASRLAAFGLPAWRTPDELVEGERRTLRAFFASAPAGAELLIAEADDGARALGFVYLETQIDYFTLERHGHMGIIAVSEAAEGQGVGRALMEAAEAWAHQRGFDRLTLNVFHGNSRARQLYERAGFEPETVRYVRRA
jgi:ribosomal protein S18 acetylase RimI-like enzyme